VVEAVTVVEMLEAVAARQGAGRWPSSASSWQKLAEPTSHD
jgi:hypothetical protein